MSWLSRWMSSWTRSPDVIDGARARALVSDGALLLDVRTPAEFADGALPGALNIPVSALQGRLSELDDARPVVVYCRSGARSASAAGTLKRAGFTDTWDLGPMSAW